MSSKTGVDADGDRYTTAKEVVDKDGVVHEIPDWAPRRVYLDSRGRPELFMNPRLFLGAGAAERSTPAKPRTGRVDTRDLPDSA